MFLEQLADQVGSVRVFITERDLNFGQQNLQSVLTQIHQVKGGAGFFGLEKVAQAAAAVQDELKIFEVDGDIRNKETLTRLFQDLEEAVSRIPSPESLLHMREE